MKIRYCRKGCHITDKSKDLCPNCGSFMIETDERDKESIISDITQMQKESGQDTLRGRYVNNKI